MSLAVLQLQPQLAIGTDRGDPTGIRNNDALSLRVGAVGDEHAVPYTGLLIHIIDIDDQVLVFVIEDPRFDLFLDRRGEQVRLETLQGAVPARQDSVHQIEVHQNRTNEKYRTGR